MKFFKTIFLLLLVWNIYAQEDIKFQKPSSVILNLADYEREPSVSMDRKKENMLFLYRNTYKTLQDLNIEEMRLGGLRINPTTNISSTVTYNNNIKVRKVSDYTGEPKQVQGLPANPQISNMSWSPDNSWVAFTHTTDNGVELWVLEMATATAKKLTNATLNANMGFPFAWSRDNKSLLIRQLPTQRGKLLDAKNELPSGPIVTNADGKVSQNRTFQDLLKNKMDETNFELLTTSELNFVDLNGNISKFLPSAIYSSQSFSPDGQYLMVTTIEKPFSYIVPYSRFPQKTIVYNLNDKSQTVVNQLDLFEITPKGFNATRPGKRSLGWRPDKPASLYYVVALDGGDPANKVPFRDELFTWDAPFTASAVSLAKVEQRFGGVQFGNENTAFIFDTWYDTRNTRAYIIDPSNPGKAPRLIHDRNYQDIYSDPGRLATTQNDYGQYVVAIEKDIAYLIGEGYTEKGQFPFIDELNIKTLKTKRLYQSAYTDKKESISSIEDFKKGIALVSIQSKTEYPNYYFRHFKTKQAPTQITFSKNPFAELNNVHKEVVKYKRNDGLELSGTLYLPAGYDKTKKEKLPLLIWAYPQEFKDRNSAAQSDKNPNEFTFPSYGSFIYWVMKGYAVLDDAAFPIIGEGDQEPNDNFIQQLVANGRAAIDYLDGLGYIDRKRVGVGGHSYGAFMTANLLTHSDDYACGVARSGAYNRTLTPFGFQSEQRNFWDAPEIYSGMSPFFTAHKMKKPILLIHGEADNNPGTFTLQTERYFQAIKGLGGNARMVILPKESHGYAAKENILHMLWEQEQFLDKYLKGNN